MENCRAYIQVFMKKVSDDHLVLHVGEHKHAVNNDLKAHAKFMKFRPKRYENKLFEI